MKTKTELATFIRKLQFVVDNITADHVTIMNWMQRVKGVIPDIENYINLINSVNYPPEKEGYGRWSAREGQFHEAHLIEYHEWPRAPEDECK